MIKEIVYLASGASIMALVLTPEAQTTEPNQETSGFVTSFRQVPASNIVLDEDAYWEYDNDEVDDVVFGEPMVKPEAGAVDNSKTMFKKVPKKAAIAKGKTDWKLEYPKPLD